jgi:acetyl esterase/lipase
MRQSTAAIVACVVATCCGISPRPSAQEATSAAPIVHTYSEVEGAALELYVFKPTAMPPNGSAPAILLFHGGGWVAGSPEWTFEGARRYAAAGLVAMSVEYRLSGERVTPVDALADVCGAFRWVRDRAQALGVAPHRIAASGTSAGGHLAAAATTIGCGNTEGAYGNGGPDALVLWSPALDVSSDGHFRRLLRGRAMVEAFSPVEHVRARMPPVHIVHGERDTLTPLGGARRFCERVQSGGSRCELVVYPGVGHLLTRNLTNQESDFDPDPSARADGIARQLAFVQSLWKQ